MALGHEFRSCPEKYDDDFDILNWWRDIKITYPVLSILAKDILSREFGVSFSLVSRVIEERRRRLAPNMVEMLSLVKDWEEADAGRNTPPRTKLRWRHLKTCSLMETKFEPVWLCNELIEPWFLTRGWLCVGPG
ncbi:hypothetical protein U9M48_004744 [Paspalum notatum var. saurae]|uniref:HAT C-terminal dimerisation domain-containing protein n=1 Tax=Paspalum notatum var. saurae TaxID=547442 RepID=A0AAQ3PVC4_PASNO